MPEIVLGPMLRRVDESTAAVWVETDSPCQVGILDATEPTFTVHGHHYALVEVTGLTPGTATEYHVTLDGERVWPRPHGDFPPPVIRTVAPHGSRELVFGSCRISAPQHEGNAKHGVDMLYALAHRLKSTDPVDWPDALLMLGDQVYADEPPQPLRDFISQRRDTSREPGEEIADFEEYTELYRVAWTDPAIGWLMATLPTLMIFDDHDLRDDWNTSRDWRDKMSRLSWWKPRVIAALGSYWIYQHLGNLSSKERASDPLYSALRGSSGDGAKRLDEFAWRAWEDSTSVRWSYCHQFGSTRLIMLDSRCARDLTPGKRLMVDDPEWAWFRQQLDGEIDQLLIGSSVPVLLPTGLHYVESWNEAVCDGAWGKLAGRVAEVLRQAIDLEHWAAFRDSFKRMSHVIMDLVRGGDGERPPANVVFLSGDVHYSYLNTARIKGARSLVHQVTCSAIRHPLSRLLRWANVMASIRVADAVGYLLAGLAKVRRTPFSWRMTRGPWFDNALASIRIDGRDAEVRWHSADEQRPETMTELGRARLSGEGAEAMRR